MGDRFGIRVIAPIMAMSLLLLGVGVGTAWFVHRLQVEASALVDDSVSAIQVAQGLVIDSREIRSRLHDYIDTEDPSHLEEVAELNTQLRESLEEAESQVRTEPERELVAKVREGVDAFMLRFEKVVEDVDPESESMAKAPLRVLIEENINYELIRPAHDYLEFRREQIAASSKQNQAVADRVRLALILLGLCGSVAGLVGGYGIHRAISSTFVRLSVPVRDAAGKLNEVVGPLELSAGRDVQNVEELESVMQNISQHVAHVVDELQRSQRDALRAEQLAAVGQLAAGLAHELRNPLMAMKLLVQSAVERGDAGSLAGRNLRVLDEEIRRQEQAIQTFLDFARPPKLEPRSFDLKQVVEQTVALVTPRAARQGVQLHTSCHAESAVMEGDPGQIRQVLLNLLFNALDVLPGGGHVRVSIHTASGGSLGATESLEIRVADNGPGLPESLGQRVFEPFVSTKETGMGLGLSICRRIVEAHDGEILARDLPGREGAEIVVKLPASVPAAAM